MPFALHSSSRSATLSLLNALVWRQAKHVGWVGMLRGARGSFEWHGRRANADGLFRSFHAFLTDSAGWCHISWMLVLTPSGEVILFSSHTFLDSALLARYSMIFFNSFGSKSMFRLIWDWREVDKHLSDGRQWERQPVRGFTSGCNFLMRAHLLPHDHFDCPWPVDFSGEGKEVT